MDQTMLVTVLVFLLVVQAVWAVIGISSNDRVRAIRRLSSYTQPTSRKLAPPESPVGARPG